MDPEDFQNIAAGIQSAAVVLAVLAGGVWALYRFRAFREVDKARAELQSINRALQERGVLNIQLGASQLSVALESARIINVFATVKNVGERTEILNWTEGKVRVGLVKWQEDNTPAIGPTVSAALLSTHARWTSSSLRPGQENTYPFIVKVDAPGVYLIELDIKGSAKETEATAAEHEQAGIGLGALTWSTSTYFAVS